MRISDWSSDVCSSDLQGPREYSAPYDAIYEKGWDAIREERFVRMKRMGLIPASTRLPPRAPRDRAWDDLSDDEKAGVARYMAVYAGFIEHCDRVMGSVPDRLREKGLPDNSRVNRLSEPRAAHEAGAEGVF